MLSNSMAQMDPKIKSAFLYTASKIRVDEIRLKIQESGATSVLSLINMISSLVTKEVNKLFKLTRDQRNELLIHVLTDIAKGADGLFGTEDDIISAETLEELKVVLNTSFLQHVLTLVDDINKGKCYTAVKRLPLCCYSLV